MKNPKRSCNKVTPNYSNPTRRDNFSPQAFKKQVSRVLTSSDNKENYGCSRGGNNQKPKLTLALSKRKIIETDKSEQCTLKNNTQPNIIPLLTSYI
jgi:hypothetical protein